MERSRKLLIFYLVFLLFNWFSFSYAQETDYSILGIKGLGENPTLTEVVAFYFSFALIIGMGLAIAIIVYAGFNMVYARGDVAKLEAQKTRIINAFYGLIVLFSSYIIINFINPGMLGINNPEITPPVQEEPTRGICLNYTDSENKSGRYCTETDIANVSYTVTGIEWISSEEELPMVYFYSETNFQGNSATLINGELGIPYSPKSVYLSWRKEGAFLYDGTNYNLINASLPAYIDKDAAALPQGFDNKVKSIKFVNPLDNSYKYGAILFGDPSFLSNNCSWIVDDIPNLDVRGTGEEGEQNTPPLGNNRLSSMLLLKTAPESNATVTFYSRANCEVDPSQTIIKTNPVTGERALFNTGECAVSKSNYQIVGKINNINIYSKSICPEFIGDVASFKLNGSTGILLRTGLSSNPGACQFFKPSDSCVNVLKYGSVYNQDADPPITPQSFTLIPLAGD